MENIDYFVMINLPLEGGKSDHPDDRGGLTFAGITYSTLLSLKYDTDQNGIVNQHDLMSLTTEDIKKILRKGKFYLASYDTLNPELAYFLTDWKWASGFQFYGSYIHPLFIELKTLLNNHEVLYYLGTVRAFFYRQIIQWRIANSTFKAGWYKRLILNSMRHNLGVSVNPSSILKRFKYDRRNGSVVNPNLTI